jgi:hypothetical protein
MLPRVIGSAAVERGGLVIGFLEAAHHPNKHAENPLCQLLAFLDGSTGSSRATKFFDRCGGTSTHS